MKKYTKIFVSLTLAAFSMAFVAMAESTESVDATVSMEVNTFEDEEVQDRALSDWDGRWQSAYPFALDGSLDEAFDLLATSGKMTAKEYKEYFENALETDIAFISIDGENNTIEYEYMDGHTSKSEYQYVGCYIQEWSGGTKAALYRFEALDKDAGAPIYIELNDHIIKPAKSGYFHFRSSDTGFDDIEDPENRWAKFYPADLNAEELQEAFILHDHTLDSSAVTVPVPADETETEPIT